MSEKGNTLYENIELNPLLQKTHIMDNQKPCTSRQADPNDVLAGAELLNVPKNNHTNHIEFDSTILIESHPQTGGGEPNLQFSAEYSDNTKKYNCKRWAAISSFCIFAIVFMPTVILTHKLGILNSVDIIVFVSIAIIAIVLAFLSILDLIVKKSTAKKISECCMVLSIILNVAMTLSCLCFLCLQLQNDRKFYKAMKNYLFIFKFFFGQDVSDLEHT